MKVSKLRRTTIVRQTIIIVLCIAAGWYIKAKLTPKAPQMAQMGGVPQVLVAKSQKVDMLPERSYIGKVEAIQSVDIHPQISGYVEKILFKEGSLVKAGDILFIIEPQRYEANVKLAEANLDQAQAVLVKVEKDYKRQKSLNKQKFASEAALDAAQAALEEAKAAVKQAAANLDLARINLAYTEIKAPIDGIIGKALVTEGNFVNSSTQTLARIVQNAPIRVTFSISDKDFLSMTQKAQELGQEFVEHQLVLSNNTIFNEQPSNTFFNNEIDAATATMPIYLEYPNQKNWLIPGNYVTVNIADKGGVENAVSIITSAVNQDKTGTFVYVVNENNIVEERRVKLGKTKGNKQVVLEGLEIGENIIVQGIQKVKHGSSVQMQEIPQQGEL